MGGARRRQNAPVEMKVDSLSLCYRASDNPAFILTSGQYTLSFRRPVSLTPKLNPYIKKYVNLYGWPIDNIFDSELMSKIIINNTTLP